MKRIITVTICILIALIFIVSLFGCDSFELNEEKDNASVVATVNGEDITKAEFNDYLTFNMIIYEINDYDIPTDEDELESFKEDLFNDYIANLTYQCEAQALGLEIDSDNVSDSIDEMLTSTEEYYGDEDSYDAALADYGLTEDTFETLVTTELNMLAYSNAYQDNDDNDLYRCHGKTAVTVGGVDIPNYILYYYVIMDELTTYLSDETIPKTKTTCSICLTNQSIISHRHRLLSHTARSRAMKLRMTKSMMQWEPWITLPIITVTTQWNISMICIYDG
jgi:hypothetical protein